MVDVERAAPEIAELHHFLLEHDFPRLESYPWPGRLVSLYYDPGILFRHLSGASNCWQASALSSLYYARLRRSEPALWTLCQAFLLCEPVAVDRLERELTPQRCERWQEAGVLVAADGCYVSSVRATPWQGRLLWHDAPPGFRQSFVFLGADSLTFARYLARWIRENPKARCRRALDLCTGAGIHALMLTDVAEEVTGADINPRALAYGRLNASLRSVANVSFVLSDLFPEAAQGPYDLIVANLPLLFLPEELRPLCVDGDGGMLGIECVVRLVDGLGKHLAQDGTAILQANSPVVDRRDLLMESLRERLDGNGWQVTLMPTHEFQDASLYAFHRAHRIQRFVTYVITLRAGREFQLHRRSLAPWRKAACAVRMATVQLEHWSSRTVEKIV